VIRWLVFITLLLALLATALSVVALRHESRQLFVQLQQASAERDQANVEWSRLQLEQAWLADASRIERSAREDLDMESPDRTRIIVTQP